MKKLLYLSLLILCLGLLLGCGDNRKYTDTTSTIINKEVQKSNQYYFYVTYKIDGMEGMFDATIKVKNVTEYNKYVIGDEYIFKRPVSK